MTVTTLMTRHDDRVASSRIEIDQLIRKHEDEVRELKYKRNLLAITSILPPELLSKIFVMVARSCATEARPSSRLSWMKLSHVSRHWRAVALACPALWSNIVFTTVGGAQEMIKRSKSAPLSIRVDFDLMTPKMVEAVQNALVHIPRTTHLHFTASSGTMDKLMSSLQQPAPALQSLFVANTYPSENYKNNRYNFPAEFLGGDAPNLRNLELLRCSIPWDSPLFANLHNLEITDPGADNRPSTDELLDLLQETNELKALALTECLPVIAEDATVVPAPSRTVALPSLAHIQLSGSTLECANLLNHLSVPQSAGIKLVCMGTEATGNDFSAITQSLSKYLEHIPIKRLHIQALGDNFLRIQAWATSDSDNKVPKTLAHIDLELTWRQYHSASAQRVVETICTALPLSHLRILHVWQIDALLPTSSWVSIFGSLPKLRTIDLHGHQPADFTEALRTKCDLPVNSGRGRRSPRDSKAIATESMCFPNLRHILFDNVDFRNNEGGNTLTSLRDVMVLRAQLGADARDLGISRCSNVPEQEVKELRKVLVDVRWDGMDLDSDDEEGFYSDEGFFPPIYQSFRSAYGELDDLLISPAP